MRAAYLLVLIGAQALAAPAESPVELRLRFSHGQRLSYRMHVEQSAELTLDQASGETRRTRTVTDAELILRALEVGDTGSRLEIDIGSFAAVQLLEGKRLSLPGGQEMKGVRLEVTLSPRGEASGAHVRDSSRLSPPVRRLAESMCRTLEQLLLTLAAEPVRLSDSWPLERRLPLAVSGMDGIRLEAKGPIRLARLEECRRQKCAWLEADLALTMKGSGGGGGLSLGADIAGRAKVSAQLGVDTNQLLKNQTEMEISGELTAAQEKEQIRTRVRLSTKVVLELVR